MSYEKAMKWQKKHPKGTRQPILMSLSGTKITSMAGLVKAIGSDSYYVAARKTLHDEFIRVSDDFLMEDTAVDYARELENTNPDLHIRIYNNHGLHVSGW
jgi:hypothetical protein